MSDVLLSLSGVSKFYTGSQSVVMGLSEVNLAFQKGEFVAITGESGSGKSTLAHVICGVLPYESGELSLKGNPTSHYDSADWASYRRDNISFIAQNYGVLTSATVLGNVLTVLRIAGIPSKMAKEKAEELLRMVELWDLRNRKASKLSSGQKQRLSIARALAKPAPILVADEPTGNLDPENRQKVIALLNEAAKERLVILITHDYREAEAYVTRHISLKDGKVIMDTPVNPRQAPGTSAQTQRQKQKKTLSLRISALQMGGRPVWSALVLLFFALTAFAVFAFLGTFMVNLDDTSTRIYDATAFANGDPKRIVVQRQDMQGLTDEDVQKLLQLPHVESLEESGYISDIAYAYRQDVDYEYFFSRESRGGDEGSYFLITRGVSFVKNRTSFLRTVPQLPEGKTFLTQGRLPENITEAVLAGSADQIGKTIDVHIRDANHWSTTDYITLQVTVVGVTNYGTGLYFHKELGDSFTAYSLAGGDGNAFLVTPAYGPSASFPKPEYEEIASITSWPEEGLRQRPEGAIAENGPYVDCYLPEGNFCSLSEVLYRREWKWRQESQSVTQYRIYNGVDWETSERVQAVGFHNTKYLYHMLINPDVFHKNFANLQTDQLSLYLTDYAYTDAVLEELKSDGYLAVSPFRQGATAKNKALAAERMQTLTVCLAALAAVIALQLIVQRELFGIQMESYKLLADMGLGYSTARNSILWQVLSLIIAGQGLAFAAIGCMLYQGVERIASICHYLPWENWVLLSAVHLVFSLLSGLLTISSLHRKVFPQLRQKLDLPMEEEAEAKV